MHAPHAADVLETEVPDLGAPPQVERVQGEHGRDVADADVCDVDAPEKDVLWSSIHMYRGFARQRLWHSSKAQAS